MNLIHVIASKYPDLFYLLEATTGRYPILYYMLFAKSYPFSEMRVNSSTGICIEGYPRSANSYAVVAFRLVNREVQAAHHLHVPAQIISACRLRIPTVAVIRHPLEAVSSFLLFQSSGNANLYLNLYTKFYRSIWPYRDQFVSADFEQVTADFNQIIEKCNHKFDTRFNTVSNLEQRQEEIFQKLSAINQRFFAGRSHRSMVPDEARSAKKKMVRERVAESPALDKAVKIYDQFRILSE